jgi:hypothetical protein
MLYSTEGYTLVWPMLIIPPTDKKKSFSLPVIASGFLEKIHKPPFAIFVKMVNTFEASEIDYHVHVQSSTERVTFQNTTSVYAMSNFWPSRIACVSNSFAHVAHLQILKDAVFKLRLQLQQFCRTLHIITLYWSVFSSL